MIVDRSLNSATLKAPRERGLGKVVIDQHLVPGHDLGIRAIVTPAIARAAEGAADTKAVVAGEVMTAVVEVDVEDVGAVGVVTMDQQLKRPKPPRRQHQRLQHLRAIKHDLP
jgi:hypothetical protein